MDVYLAVTLPGFSQLDGVGEGATAEAATAAVESIPVKVDFRVRSIRGSL